MDRSTLLPSICGMLYFYIIGIPNQRNEDDNMKRPVFLLKGKSKKPSTQINKTMDKKLLYASNLQ